MMHLSLRTGVIAGDALWILFVQNIFNSLSLPMDIWTMYTILGWRFFSFFSWDAANTIYKSDLSLIVIYGQVTCFPLAGCGVPLVNLCGNCCVCWTGKCIPFSILEKKPSFCPARAFSLVPFVVAQILHLSVPPWCTSSNTLLHTSHLLR